MRRGEDPGDENGPTLDDCPTLRVYGNTDGPELRLITCGGEYDDSPGHHVDNVVVSARVADLPA